MSPEEMQGRIASLEAQVLRLWQEWNEQQRALMILHQKMNEITIHRKYGGDVVEAEFQELSSGHG